LYKMISFNKALRFNVFIRFGIILFLLGGCQSNNIETKQTLLSESKNMPKIDQMMMLVEYYRRLQFPIN
jgi:hypothetical protein